MTIGETQYQFGNFKVESGAIQFPELAAVGAKSPSITVVSGAFETATKLAIEALSGGQLALVTPLVLNGEKVLVNTSSLIAFGEAVASGSKTAANLTQIVKDLTSEPEILGSFVLSLVANSKLTGELEKVAKASKANKAADEKAYARLKVRVATDLRLLKPVILSAEEKAALESVVSTEALANQFASKAAREALANQFASKAAREALESVVSIEALANQFASKAASSGVKEAAKELKSNAKLSTAAKVALVAATVATVAFAAVTLSTPFFDVPEEPVLEIVVEAAPIVVQGTSNAVYAAAAKGIALAGYGAVKVKQAVDEIRTAVSNIQL